RPWRTGRTAGPSCPPSGDWRIKSKLSWTWLSLSFLILNLSTGGSRNRSLRLPAAFLLRGQPQAVHPLVYILLTGAGAEPLSLLPVAGAGQLGQQFSALAQAGAGGGAEGDDRLAAEVIGLQIGRA